MFPYRRTGLHNFYSLYSYSIVNSPMFLSWLFVFENRLSGRNYSQTEFDNTMSTINLNCNSLLQKSNRTTERPIVMVTKYNPAAKNKLLKHWKLFQQHYHFVNLFKNKPILAFKHIKDLHKSLDNK